MPCITILTNIVFSQAIFMKNLRISLWPDDYMSEIISHGEFLLEFSKNMVANN